MNGIEPLRKEPGKLVSLILTIIVHGALVLFLFFGVRWQSSPPAALEVELVGPLKLASAPPPPRVQTPPTPKPPPVVKETPPPPPPPPPQVKPEIAVSTPKKPPELPKPPPPKPPVAQKPPEPKPPVQPPKPKPPEPKPPEPKPPAPAPDYMSQLLEKELGKNEEAKIERTLRGGDSPRASSPQSTGELNAYLNAIRITIRSKMIEPPGLRGNPEARFSVIQLPTGEVMDVRLVRSSGLPQFDAAVENAIRGARQLPLPKDPTLFSRELDLIYRLRDD